MIEIVPGRKIIDSIDSGKTIIIWYVATVDNLVVIKSCLQLNWLKKVIINHIEKSWLIDGYNNLI